MILIFLGIGAKDPGIWNQTERVIGMKNITCYLKCLFSISNVKCDAQYYV